MHASRVIDVEVIETPQRDWWVVADGRVVALSLKRDGSGDHYRDALAHADEMSGEGVGFSILSLGSTWRSMAFDHLNTLSCRRGTCCRYWPNPGEPPDGWDRP